MSTTPPTPIKRPRRKRPDAQEAGPLRRERDTQDHRSTSSMLRPALIDIDSVAELLGVSVRHVRRLVLERRVPYVKWGGLVRFDPGALEEWLEDKTVHPQLPRRAGARRTR